MRTGSGRRCSGLTRVDDEPSIYRTAEGDYELDIPGAHRDLLKGLSQELRAILDSDHPSLRRLFHPAYPDDPERNAEYDSMVRRDLLAGRKQSLAIVEETAGSGRLNAEQLGAWLSALNDLRLFIGTSLDVSEDTYDLQIRPDDPDARAHAIYLFLGWLEEQAVEALAADLEIADRDDVP
jgi:hypothetical protein